MAVQPSLLALAFTNFLKDVSTWRYTASGQDLIDQIQTAAINQTTVTDQTFQDYMTYVSFRYEYFLMYQDLAT